MQEKVELMMMMRYCQVLNFFIFIVVVTAAAAA